MSDLFNPELYVSDVSVYYGSKCAVQNVSFNIHPGQLTAIIGNNGCGKTSLIRAVMNLVKHSGKCMLGELHLESMSVRKRAGMISYIPQRTGISISMTVREVCLLGFNPQLHMLESYNFNMRHRADKAIDSVGLAGLYDTDFLTLSEGQKQLCILARTLIEASALLLLDEPFSALDYQTRLQVSEDVRDIIKTEQKTAILVTHDISEAISMADTVFLLPKIPGYVKKVIPIEFEKQGIAHESIRQSKLFQEYFDLIWKELQNENKETR